MPLWPWPESSVTSHSHRATLSCAERQVEFAKALDISGKRNRGVKDGILAFGLSKGRTELPRN